MDQKQKQLENYLHYEAEQKKAAVQEREDSKMLDFFLWGPFQFICKNMPAVIPAWAVTFCALPYVFEAINLAGVAFAFAMLIGFILSIGFFWALLRGVHNFALRLDSATMRNSIIGIVLGYVFLAYAAPLYLILGELTEWSTLALALLSFVAGAAGTGFYYNNLRHNLSEYLTTSKSFE